jgi:hypothetical protein
MSPVSRGRKGKKTSKSTRRPVLVDVSASQDECDCPACSGEGFDPQQMVDDLLESGADFLAVEDPLDAELTGAVFVSFGEMAGAIFEEALVGGFIQAFEARASAEALAMLLAIGSVAEGQPGKAAWAAADRLVEAGVARPAWASELGEAVVAADCWRIADPAGVESILACAFHRAGRSHAVVVTVDDLDCGAAEDIILLDGDALPQALEAMHADMRAAGLEATMEALSPPEIRWQIETALDARAVHDSDEPELESELPIEDDGVPPYHALAALVRARMNALPASGKPKVPHADQTGRGVGLAALDMLAQHAEGGQAGAGAPMLSRSRVAPPKLPPKRKKSDGLAPVFQIKVGLRDAKPPIWRRLEVPADVSLARLHAVIQTAFGWNDSHLHVFETAYGEFGVADAELGHRAESKVTLEQVAPGAQSKIRYTYDFGDAWEHDILVEKVVDRDNSASYPRCTGGRRAAPPEDCGGVWGYADLVEVLSDPDHPEHEEVLEWLGLEVAADFDTTSFDAEAVNRELSRLRR